MERSLTNTLKITTLVDLFIAYFPLGFLSSNACFSKKLQKKESGLGVLILWA